MQIDTIGVHESVGAIFPPAVLRDALSDLEPAIAVVREGSDLGACDAVVTFAYADDFLGADLQWIHSVQAGVDRFPFDDLGARGIALTNSTGIHGDSVGEAVAGYMLMFARRLHTFVRNQVDHAWDRPAWDEPFTLEGRSLCVVGLGTLGSGIARRADALGMSVTGVKRTVEAVDHVDRVFGPDDLIDAIAEPQFVALAVPLNDDTYHLLGREELAAMREDAYLINVARGSVVDEPALIEALRDDRLRGAALDVFEEEPLPAGSPLWDMDEVVVSPHASSATRAYYERVADLVRENARRIAAGEPMTNRVV